jgi:hypothetical protein
MKPIYFTLSSGTALKVIPDTHVYQDGHPIISYTYSLFHNREKKVPAVEKEITGNAASDYVNHPDYAGFITFEEPGKLFTYTSYGEKALSLDEAEEAIEQLNHIRDNPALWPFSDRFKGLS